MNLDIRPAEYEDLQEILALYRQLHPGDEPLSDGERRDAVWASMLNQPGFTCLVAIHADKIVASCCLVVFPNLTHGGRSYALIENVIIDRPFRRRGFGKALMDNALTRAWAAGCHTTMLLSSVARVDAHRFYESCGFRSDTKVGFVIRANPNLSGHAASSSSTSNPGA